jgi:outer membrane protein assembly factor BamB
MPRHPTLVLLLGACACLAGAPAAGQVDKEALAADQATLKSAGVDSDGKSVLGFIKKRTLGEKDRARIAVLVKHLGADDFEEREKASRELVVVGPVARPQLLEARGSKNLEVSRRAQRALDEIGKSSSPAVLSAAVRVLGHDKPAGTVEALVAYLGTVEDAEIVEDVVGALGKVGAPAGKADPLLLEALGDKHVTRRAAVAEALARALPADKRGPVRKLLKDPDLTVRARAAIALVQAQDKLAVPTLIDLLERLSGEERVRVDDLLQRIGGEKAPQPDADTPAARRKYQLAWEAWWRDNGARADLSKLEGTTVLRNFTVIAVRNIRGPINNSKVMEIDKTGRTRWEISGLRYPVFAQVVKGDRVLIAEPSNLNRVSERTFKGEIIWQKTLPTQVVSAQRLANGNTFVVGRNQLIELDRTGKEVKVITRPSFDVVAAAKDRDGTIGIVTNTGQFYRLDAAGKQLKNFSVGFLSTGWGTNIQLLPRGRVLVPQTNTNRVVEYDENGRIVWSASVAQPNSVRRLPNGHTLVTTRFNSRVVELDKNGRQVWSHNVDGYAQYADRR